MADPRRDSRDGGDADARPRKLRLFVGVRVSMDTVEALSRAATDMSRRADREGMPIRWLRPAAYHLTLKFLGWARPESVEALKDVMRECAEPVPGPLSFTTRGLGAFPKPEKARVLWAGIDEPDGRLPRLAEALEAGCARIGFEREHRPFHGHVTLARLKRPSDVSGLIAGASEQGFSKTSAGELVLFQSIMKSSGSEYVPVAEISFEGGSNG